jgi:hypothetical protein
LDLPKTKAQLLGLWLQQWNLLGNGVKVPFYKMRQSNIATYFSMDGEVVYCSNDICHLMEKHQLQHAPEQWRLFVDSSEVSLKADLLRNGHKCPSVSLAHAVHMKETNINIQGLLKKMCYEDQQWDICADLKVVVVLTGLKGGCTKFCCFVCEWDS